MKNFRIEKYDENKHGHLIEELTKMLHSAYRPLAEKGMKYLALDTSEHAHQLISMYKKLNYRFIEYANWNVTNYRSVVLSKELG